MLDINWNLYLDRQQLMANFNCENDSQEWHTIHLNLTKPCNIIRIDIFQPSPLWNKVFYFYFNTI